jgi:hypothetical protein
MNALLGNAGLPESPAAICAPQGVITLISRAWNLLRLNLKKSMMTMLAPTLLLTVFYIVISIPASQTFLTPTPASRLAISATTGLLGLGLGILSFLFWGVSCCALIRLYYSTIVRETPFTLRECWTFVNRIKWPLILMLALSLVLMVVFVIVDFLLFFAGMLTSAALFGLLGTMSAATQSGLLAIMLIFAMILWGFVVLSLLLILVTTQGFCFVFPIISLATSETVEIPWWKHLLAGYRMILSNLPRLILFALALFAFSIVVSMVMNTPILLWAWLERARLGVSEQHHVPLYVHAMLNLWRSLADLFLIPFYISAATLFWYDCRVRKEGLDLQLWLAGILRRRGKQPEDFLADPAL